MKQTNSSRLSVVQVPLVRELGRNLYPLTVGYRFAASQGASDGTRLPSYPTMSVRRIKLRRALPRGRALSA